MEKYHGGLFDAEVTVDVLFASRKNEGDDAPVKLHGVPCLACIRTVPYKARVLGGADLEITIDKEEWEETCEETRIATLDHELTHRTLQVDRDGQVKRDDLERPLFNVVEHDFHFGWFASTALRHGAKSIEVVQARQMIESDRWQTCIQRFLPGLEPIEAVHQEPDTDNTAATPVRIETKSWTGETTVGELKDIPARVRRPKNAGKK